MLPNNLFYTTITLKCNLMKLIDNNIEFLKYYTIVFK